MSERALPEVNEPAKKRLSREAISGRLRKLASDPQLCAVIIINILFTAFFLHACLNTGLYGGDYGYRYVFDAEAKLTGSRVGSLADVIASQTACYQVVSGRSTAHFLLQLVLIWGHKAFSVLNAVMYCLLGVGMYMHTLSERDRRASRHRPFSQLVIYLLPWLLFPDFGNVYHTETLAAEYLWTMTVIIWFLLPYRLLLERRDVFGCDKNDGRFARRTYLSALLMFFAGTAAGWCSENGSAAALFMIGGTGLYYILRKKAFPFWCVSGFAGCLFGFVMMLASPGNRIRQDNAAVPSFAGRLGSVFSTHTMMPYGCVIILLLVCLCFLIYTDTRRGKKPAAEFALLSSSAMVAVLIVNLVFPGKTVSAYIDLALCAVIAVYFFRLLSRYPRRRLKPVRYIPWVYIAGALIANAALVFMPFAQIRDQLPFLLLLTAAAAMIFENTLDRLQKRLDIYNIKRLAIASLFIYSVISLSIVSVRTDAGCRQFELMEQSIGSSKAAGVTDITIKKPELSSDRRVAGPYTAGSDADSWINQAFCQYYGISSVTFE